MLSAIIKDGVTACGSKVLQGCTRSYVFMHKLVWSFIVRRAFERLLGMCERRTRRGRDHRPEPVRERRQQEHAAAVSVELSQDSDSEARSVLNLPPSYFTCYNRVRNARDHYDISD